MKARTARGSHSRPPSDVITTRAASEVHYRRIQTVTNTQFLRLVDPERRYVVHFSALSAFPSVPATSRMLSPRFFPTAQW